jgi:protein SCO1/2
MIETKALAPSTRAGGRWSNFSISGKLMSTCGFDCFGFVQCPDVCPTALARASAVMQQLGTDAGRVRLLFVTVDPERDTPELLREYMAAFDPRFVALTGNPEQIQATADTFRVHFKKVPTGGSYTVDHTALTYLFDPAGRIRVALRHEQTADDYVADVRLLLAESIL